MIDQKLLDAINYEKVPFPTYTENLYRQNPPRNRVKNVWRRNNSEKEIANYQIEGK